MGGAVQGGDDNGGSMEGRRELIMVFYSPLMVLFSILLWVCLYYFNKWPDSYWGGKNLFWFVIPTAFKMLESSSQKFLQGLVYLIGNLMGLALAVYKCQSMGLLPTHASDWLAFIEPPEVSQKLGQL